MNIASTQIYCEAIPSVFVKLYILLTILNTNYKVSEGTVINSDGTVLNTTYTVREQLDKDFHTFVGSPELFLISFVLSILVSAFGISRSVMNS